MLHRLSLLAALAFAAAACATTDGDDSASDPTTEMGEEELLKYTGKTSSWTYAGIMPTLESPRITVSLKGHTAHAQGYLPKTFAGKLPFHAKTESVNGRTLVHVVYPIATVDPNGRLPNGLVTRNPEPFSYDVCGGSNFAASNATGAFGGFPFIEYVCRHKDSDGRVRSGIAFHGPITTSNGYWSLLRGPVSHACNRMLGEHVLEMSHVIGFDRGNRDIPVEVVADFDELGGKKVDVDYPATGWTRPGNAVVFPIWQAVGRRADGTTKLDMPKWACETSRCASMPANARDPYTGAEL